MKGKIFNAQEVQAIIAGTKTMFREVIKPQLPVKCPYHVGKKIFVKERFFEEIHPDSLRKNGKIHYDASCDYEVIKVDGDGFQIFYKDGTPASPWKSPVHMKQEHSRLTLEITDIKVERLKDISEDDCLDEGCYFAEVFLGDFNKPPRKIFNFSKKNLLKEDGLLDYKLAFKEYWNATHKKPEEKFEANPFVWVVNFKINK